MSGLILRRDDGLIDHVFAGVNYTDFAAAAEFDNPNVAAWDYGIIFRQTGHYLQAVGIRNGGSWFHCVRSPSDEDGSCEEQDSDLIRVGRGASNHIEVTARGGLGVLYLNGTLVARLELSGLVTPGEVSVATGIFVDDDSVSTTLYRNFIVSPG